MELMREKVVGRLDHDSMSIERLLRKVTNVKCNNDMSFLVNRCGHYMPVIQIWDIRHRMDQSGRHRDRSFRKRLPHPAHTAARLPIRVAKLLQRSAHFTENFIAP